MIAAITFSLAWFALQAGTLNDLLLNRPLIIEGTPVPDPPAWNYQQFLSQVKDLGHRKLTPEAVVALHLGPQELRVLVTVTADLAAESVAIHQEWQQWNFEYLMENIESGAVSPALRKKKQGLTLRWTEALTRQIQDLRIAFGPERFNQLDAFVLSGRPLFSPEPTTP